MLILHMRGKRHRQQMCTTVLALHPAMLPLGKGGEALSTVVVHFLQKRSPNFLRDTNHGDRLCCVCVKANTLKNIGQDVEGGLEEDQIP